MAEPALKKSVELATNPSGGTAEKKRDRLGLILVLLVTMNIAGLAGLGYAMQKLWKDFQSFKTAQRNAPVAESAEVNPLGKELQPAKLGVLYGLEAFLVNIPSEQGTKFLQLQMEFELSDPTLQDELDRKKAAVRDAVIVQLSSKTFGQLRGAKAMKELQKDLLRSVNQLLSSGKVREIYFTQFHFN